MPVVLSNVETKPWFFDIFSFLTTKLTHRYGAPVWPCPTAVSADRQASGTLVCHRAERSGAVLC